MAKINKIKEVKEEDFFFGEDSIVEFFGRDYIEELKKEDYEEYCRLRNSASFMPSDIVPYEEGLKEIEEVKRLNAEDIYNSD